MTSPQEISRLVGHSPAREEGSSPAVAAPIDPSVLLALAERCEREEPGRELDTAIGHAIGWRQHQMIEGFAIAPSWTSSLDAAVTLVPDECGLDTSRYWLAEGERHGCLISWGIAGENAEVLGVKSAALAICAAALRVLAAIAKAEGR